MRTELESWNALVLLANRLGRNGQHIRNFGIVPPRTTADPRYFIVFEGYYPKTAGESD